jgi:choline dehydrogenase-like flavoprotein
MTSAERRDAGTYDYVIVGSEAAGAILAHRLTENAGTTADQMRGGARLP